MDSKAKSMTFRADILIKTSDKEKKLYDKYGIQAVELASKKDFLAAEKLIDQILKAEPECEFALLLKASYLYNYTDNKYSKIFSQFGAISIEDSEPIQEQTKNMQKNFEDSINLIDKVLKINPKNKVAKEFQDFIKQGPMKNIDLLFTTIDNTIEKAQNLITNFEVFDRNVKKFENTSNNLIEKTQRIETSEFETYEIEINENYSQEKKDDEISDDCGCFLFFIIIFLLIFWWL